MPPEYYKFDNSNFKYEVKVKEFEIQNNDSKISAFEKEVQLKSKVQYYLYKRGRMNKD